MFKRRLTSPASNTNNLSSQHLFLITSSHLIPSHQCACHHHFHRSSLLIPPRSFRLHIYNCDLVFFFLPGGIYLSYSLLFQFTFLPSLLSTPKHECSTSIHRYSDKVQYQVLLPMYQVDLAQRLCSSKVSISASSNYTANQAEFDEDLLHSQQQLIRLSHSL